MTHNRPIRTCTYCNTPNTVSELRPYGPGGTWVCFPCGTDPKRVATTEKEFGKKLNAAGPVALIGDEDGPAPFSKGRA